MAGWSLPMVPVLQVFYFSLFAVTCTAQACYYPDQTLAVDDVPCGSGLYSACCGKNAICLSNNLCMGVKQPFVLSRASCTDKNWKSPSCPNVCISSTDQPSSGCSIVLLDSSGAKSLYCCNSITSDGKGSICNNGESPFPLDNATVIPGYAGLANLGDTSNSTTSPSSNLSCSSTPTPMQKSPSHDVAIGAGVGVPLGVIAIASLLWALWERRQRKKTVVPLVPSMTSNPAVPPVTSNPTSLYNPPCSFDNVYKPVSGGYGASEPVELDEHTTR